jgi:hypothetical protein
MKKSGLLAALLILCCLTAPAFALNQPKVNLGFTNFLDGASPGPGIYWTTYVQFYSAGDIKGHDGHTMLKGVDVGAIVNLNQFIYQSDKIFLGGNPGIDVIIPLVDIDVDAPLNSQDGVGDILVGPFIQWGPHTVFNRPYFHRFELQVTAPTGKNDNDVALNPGADVWTINPYYTFTYFLTPKLSTSLRLHYLWSEENNNANPLGQDIQAGQAIHLNYAAAYAVTDSLRLGVSGYYLEQLEEDEYDGHSIDNTEEKVFAVGPGLVWHISPDVTFMGAINWESGAENRPEGVASTLRVICKF